MERVLTRKTHRECLKKKRRNVRRLLVYPAQRRLPSIIQSDTNIEYVYLVLHCLELLASISTQSSLNSTVSDRSVSSFTTSYNYLT